MKKTHKISAVLLAAAMLLSACATQNSTETQKAEETQNTEAQTVEETVKETIKETETVEEAAKETIKDGTYTAAAWGNNGEITVETVIDGGKITAVNIVSHEETKGISVMPLATIPETIVKTQSVAVDTVTGATMTSRGIINAVSDCLTQAGADISDWETPVEVEPMTTENAECDVVIVGSGAAGMTTAIYASAAGANVILVEKQDILGGTSLLSNSMFGSVGTSVHKAEGKEETVEDLVANYLNKEAATGAYAEEPSARILAENSAAAAEYLIGLGVDFDHTSSKFILAPAAGRAVGEMVIPALTGEMEKNGVDIRLSTKAVEIIMENGAAVGVKVENKSGSYEIRAKAVVFATGGFAASRELVDKYLPQWSGSIYYCSPGDTGDGLLMAEAAGMELVDLTVMKANPLVFYDRTHALTMNAAVSAGAIMVNKEGQRFANEQGSYGISPIINSQTDGKGYVLFDDTLVAENATMQSYLEKGYLTEADSLAELAEKLGIDADNLAQTVARYQELAATGTDEDFGRGKVADLYSGSKFYGIAVKPSIQGTFGGIHTNTATEVYNTEGQIVPGMYAVGECAQEGVNGLNPMTTNLVYGKICGQNAAEYAAQK